MIRRLDHLVWIPDQNVESVAIKSLRTLDCQLEPTRATLSSSLHTLAGCLDDRAGDRLTALANSHYFHLLFFASGQLPSEMGADK